MSPTKKTDGKRSPPKKSTGPAGLPAQGLGRVLDPPDEAIVEIALDATVTRWNAAATRMFGYRADEMVGQSVARLYPADKITEPRELMARITRGERKLQFETTRVHRNGQLVRVTATFGPVHDGEGRIFGMSSVMRLSAQIKTVHDLDAQLAAIVESTDDAVISKRLDGTVLSWNPGAERLFGYSAAEMIGRSITRLFPPERITEEDLLLTSIARGERVANFETVRVRKDGSPVNVSVTLSPLRDEMGRIVGASKIARDTTERQRMIASLAEQTERFRVTLQSIADAVIATDARGNIDFVNPVAQRLTGWLQGEAVGRPIEQVFSIVSEHTGARVENPVRRCLVEQRAVALPESSLLVCRDGTKRSIEDSAAPIFDGMGDVRGAVLVFHDVSEQRRLASEMSYRATHDPLTNLLNRAEFEARLVQILAEPRAGVEHAVLYMDLDQFKLVNDACGHAVGDRLLQQIAELVMLQIAPRDTLARLGGDEFGILAIGGGIERAQALAWQICRSVEDFRFAHDSRNFRIGASIGLVPLDGQWNSSAAVLQAAEAACYAAKEEGRNRVHSWFDLDKAVRLRKGEMDLVTRLSESLEEDRLLLYAQQIVPARGEDPDRHFEILLRMPDRNGSIVPPGRFLPAAERYQMAARIDRWVVQKVFGWMRDSAEAVAGIGTIAVNLSGQSIGDRAFHRFAIGALEENRHLAGRLCFEITETAAITNLTDAVEFMGQLRALGVRIALDDFGAGASYFGYLKSIAADYLKIDGQFVQNIVRDRIDQAAVRCFCDIARSVGMQTIAECVETEAAADLLRGLGVDFLQGYLFHRPQPLDRATASRQDAGQQHSG